MARTRLKPKPVTDKDVIKTLRLENRELKKKLRRMALAFVRIRDALDVVDEGRGYSAQHGLGIGHG